MALENDAFLWELLHETPGEIYDVDEEEKFNVESYINGDTDYWHLVGEQLVSQTSRLPDHLPDWHKQP